MSEHRTIAPEISFIQDERDTMSAEEGDDRQRDTERRRRSASASSTLRHVDLEEPQTPFPELSFPEVYEILKKLGHELPRETRTSTGSPRSSSPTS